MSNQSTPADPVPGELRTLSPAVRALTADNPDPMTLSGTNSYLLAAPGAASVVVVDPGPDDASHLAALAAVAPVELVLITHRHDDHTGGARRFHEMTGAPVRAADPVHCHGGAPLRDGETISAAGIDIAVLATPGHTSDSVCFVSTGPGGDAVLTGDTVLGRGTTVIVHPDGNLGDYLASLRTLARLGHRRVLPAHGPVLPDLAAICAAYLDHRQQRLAAIRAALAALGPDAGVGAVTDAVYTDIDDSVRAAAELSVAAQLDYLRLG